MGRGSNGGNKVEVEVGVGGMWLSGWQLESQLGPVDFNLDLGFGWQLKLKLATSN